jgi:CelD/BcsL family acetyltransferase involved in cellulose biosynthesis
MPVRWLDDPGAFASPSWRALVDSDPDATFFHDPRWLKLYWEEFGAASLQVAVVERDGRDVAAAAFDLAGGTLTWLGGFEVTDYMGPVGPREDRAAAVRELMAAICDRDDWRAADLAGLPERGGWLPALRDAARDVGLQPTVDDGGVAPFLTLPDTYEAYLAALPSKQRHEIRRKERRLRERHPDAAVVDAQPDTVSDAMATFIDMHRSSSGEKGKFMAPGMELFFQRFGRELLPDGTLRLSFLEEDGTAMAGVIGFRWRDRFLLYNSAYDHRFAGAAPGMVLVAEMIRLAIEEGCDGFDMLTGDLPYKYRFGARPRRLGRLRWERP